MIPERLYSLLYNSQYVINAVSFIVGLLSSVLTICELIQLATIGKKKDISQKEAVIWLIVGLIGVILSIFFFMQVNQLTEVPDVTDFSYDHAVQTIKEHKLQVSTVDETSGDSLVTDQKPEAGIILKQGSVVTLFTKQADVQLSHLIVKRLPDLCTYDVGDVLNPSGLIVDAEYSDGTIKTLSPDEVMLSPSILDTAGANTRISVHYEGEETWFDVEVLSTALESLNIIYTPKASLYLGDSIDLTDIEVIAYFSDGVQSEIPSSDYTYSIIPDLENKQYVFEVAYCQKGASLVLPFKIPTIEISVESTRSNTLQLNAIADPVELPIHWQSSDPSVLNVDANGLITAYNAGTAVITASFDYADTTYYTEQLFQVNHEQTFGEWSAFQDEPISETAGIQTETVDTYVRTEYLWGHYCLGYPEYITKEEAWSNSSYHEIGWFDSNDPRIVYFNGDEKHIPGDYVYYPNGSSSFWRCSNTCFRLYVMEEHDVTKTQYRWRTVTDCFHIIAS